MKRVLFFAFHAPSFLRTAINTTAKRSLSTTTIMSAASQKNLVVDPFCFRQFAESDASQSYGGTVFSIKISEFEDIVNAKYNEQEILKDGYAPFCKHVFVVNDFTDGRVNVLPLSKENEHLVRTEYVARNDKELPVLQRCIPVDLLVGGAGELPVAKYLDLILYSREQIQKENQSMMGKEASSSGDETETETAPWGIVSIKAQDVDYELPMNPITVMRNSLGKDEGGSGVPLDRDAYMEAVNYWKANVVVS